MVGPRAVTLLLVLCCVALVHHVGAAHHGTLVTAMDSAARRSFMADVAAELDDDGDDNDRDRSRSETLSETVTISDTVTPPPTPTPSASVSITESDLLSLSASDSLVPTESDSLTLEPPPCEYLLSVTPLQPEVLRLVDIIGTPEDKYGDSMIYFETSAVVLREQAFDVNVILKDGIFAYGPTVDPNDFVRVMVKERLFYAAVASSEPYFSGPDGQPAAFLGDYPSPEGHGLQNYLIERIAELTVDRQQSSLSVRLKPIETYRLAAPEWIIVAFRDNMTIPGQCGPPKPVVMHITSFEPTVVAKIAEYVCFVNLIAGVLAAAAGGSVPSSHQSAMVAVITSYHFAQEDGFPLSLAIHPLVFPLGDTRDKYRFARAAMFGDLFLCALVLITQNIAVLYLKKKKGMKTAVAKSKALYPRVFSATVIHLAPSMLYAIARNLGNLSTMSYAYTSVCVVLFFVLLFIAMRVLLSLSGNFGAEFVDGPAPTVHPLIPDRILNDNRDEDQARPALLRSVVGYWKSMDRHNAFVIMFGYCFENMRPNWKMWLVWEFIDTFLTSVLAVFDNYTPFLAFTQFFLTFIVKLAVIFAIILARPLISPHATVLYLLLYIAQAASLLALSIGSLRLPLLEMMTWIHDLACLVAAVVILVDIGISVARSLTSFYETFTRSREYGAQDGTADHAIELDATLLHGRNPTGEDSEDRAARERAAMLAEMDDSGSDVLDSFKPDFERYDDLRDRETHVDLGGLYQKPTVNVNAAVAESDAVRRAEEEKKRVALEAAERAAIESGHDGLSEQERHLMAHLDAVPLERFEENDDDVYDSDGIEIDEHHPKFALRRAKQQWREFARARLDALGQKRRAHTEKLEKRMADAVAAAERQVEQAKARKQEAEIRRVREAARAQLMRERLREAKASGVDVSAMLLNDLELSGSSAGDGSENEDDDESLDSSSAGGEFAWADRSAPAAAAAAHSTRDIVTREELEIHELRGPAREHVKVVAQKAADAQRMGPVIVLPPPAGGAKRGGASAAGDEDSESDEQLRLDEVAAAAGKPLPPKRAAAVAAAAARRRGEGELSERQREALKQERHERNTARRRANYWADLETEAVARRPARRLTEEDYLAI